MINKKIAIFDLDDTLIHSDAKIRVFNSESNEMVSSLSPTQFNYHIPGQTQYFSFEDFDCEKILGRSKLYPNTYRSFKRYLDKGVPVSIITARSNKKIIIDFFKTKNIHLKPSLVYPVSNPNSTFTGNIAQRKKQAIAELISKGYNNIIFYDDNIDNLAAALELNSDDVQVKIIHVSHGQKSQNRTKS
jgi:hydroxymethylpyrimidine pyrophosphatase-like HAD family hydrolase